MQRLWQNRAARHVLVVLTVRDCPLLALWALFLRATGLDFRSELAEERRDSAEH